MVKNKFLYALFLIFNRFRLEKVVEDGKSDSDSEPSVEIGVGVEPRLPKIAGVGVDVSLRRPESEAVFDSELVSL